jgi:hypothetical protein
MVKLRPGERLPIERFARLGSRIRANLPVEPWKKGLDLGEIGRFIFHVVVSSALLGEAAHPYRYRVFERIFNSRCRGA